MTSLLDMHVHAWDLAQITQVVHMADSCGYEAYTLLGLSAYRPSLIGNNSVCLLGKLTDPNRAYAFASLIHPLRHPEDALRQSREFMSAGYDGIKMLEGKPCCRKRTGMALYGDFYLPFLRYLEKEQIPILYHINDPDTFWDPDRCPSWARRSGWFWGNGEYLSKAEVEKEALEVLNRFPDLRVILAHFFFQSEDIDRAAMIMERYPGVSFDITPGWEMYGNFSRHPDEWRDFFRIYRRRILYGTDTYAPEWNGIVSGVRRFLETSDEFLDAELGLSLSDGDMAIRGIHLDTATLDDIYADNFRRFLPHAPKPVDLERAIEGILRLKQAEIQGTDGPSSYDDILREFRRFSAAG